MEKQETKETVRPASIESGSTHNGAPEEWHPGFWARFPWIGFAALFTVLICVSGSIITLCLSDGDSEQHWKFAPNVILSGLNNVANLCFTIAIGNGIAIAWWRRTLKGASIQELQRNWAFSTSIKEIVFSLKYFNVIALGALAAKLMIIDGMLMQRATTTTLRLDNPVNIDNVRGFANDTMFPITGYTRVDDDRPALMTHWSGDTLKIWSQTGGVFPNFWSGCPGQCSLQVHTIGFAFNCTDPQSEPIDYLSNFIKEGENSTTQISDEGPFLTAPLFNLNFGINYSVIGSGAAVDYSFLSMDILFTNASEGLVDSNGQHHCPGVLTRQSCQLRPAIISYPLQVSNYSGVNQVIIGTKALSTKNTSTSDATIGRFNQTGMQQNGFEVVRYLNWQELHNGTQDDTSSPLAGVQLAFDMYLASEATIQYAGEDGFYVDQKMHAANYLTDPPPQRSCAFAYIDPMEPYHAPNGDFSVPSIVGKINQIMFGIGTDISRDDTSNNETDTKAYQAVLRKETIHFVSHYAYMAGAVASTIVCVILVLPTYWGFWQLGRKVTLGPLEVAHAFRSPVTASARSTQMDELMKDVGERQIKYGQVVAGDGQGRLAVAEPANVAQVQPGFRTTRVSIRDSNNDEANRWKSAMN